MITCTVSGIPAAEQACLVATAMAAGTALALVMAGGVSSLLGLMQQAQYRWRWADAIAQAAVALAAAALVAGVVA